MHRLSRLKSFFYRVLKIWFKKDSNSQFISIDCLKEMLNGFTKVEILELKIVILRILNTLKEIFWENHNLWNHSSVLLLTLKKSFKLQVQIKYRILWNLHHTKTQKTLLSKVVRCKVNSKIKFARQILNRL